MLAPKKPRSFKQRRGSLAPYVTGFHTRLPNLRQQCMIAQVLYKYMYNINL